MGKALTAAIRQGTLRWQGDSALPGSLIKSQLLIRKRGSGELDTWACCSPGFVGSCRQEWHGPGVWEPLGAGTGEQTCCLMAQSLRWVQEGYKVLEKKGDGSCTILGTWLMSLNCPYENSWHDKPSVRHISPQLFKRQRSRLCPRVLEGKGCSPTRVLILSQTPSLESCFPVSIVSWLSLL